MRTKKSIFTDEQIKLIGKDYESDMTITEIRNKWGVAGNTLHGYIDKYYEMIGQERPTKGRKRAMRKSRIVCRSCGAIAPAGAKFCPYCGKPIKTPAELMVDKVLWLRAGLLHLLPQERRAEYDEAFLAVKDFIIGGGKNA